MFIFPFLIPWKNVLKNSYCRAFFQKKNRSKPNQKPKKKSFYSTAHSTATNKEFCIIAWLTKIENKCFKVAFFMRLVNIVGFVNVTAICSPNYRFVLHLFVFGLHFVFVFFLSFSR